MDFVDIAVSNVGRSYFDIDFENGDIKTTNGFETALLMSVLGEKRALQSEVPAPERQRGWWGNEALDFADYEIGSKLWLLAQARQTQVNLNHAQTYVRDSLQWFVDDGFLDEVEVGAQYNKIGDESVMEILVNLVRFQNSVLSKGFKIWQNTGAVTVS